MDRLNYMDIAKSLIQKHAAGELAAGYKLVGVHPYHDANGKLLHLRVRLKHPISLQKWIRPFYLDKTSSEFLMREPKYPNGKPLYRLPEILSDKINDIWFVEGETCVEAAEKIGLLATTVGSESNIHTADLHPLQNRRIIIWPDNDVTGMRYAEEAIKKLLVLEAKIYQVDIQKLELKPKDDIVNWLNNNPAAGKEEIEKLPLLEIVNTSNSNLNSAHAIIYRNASDIVPKPITWLWPDHFACGKYSMIAGDPGLGKSQLTAYMAAIVTTGGRWPDGTTCDKQGRVLFLSAEDDPECTMVPRLKAAGADLSKVSIVEAVSIESNHQSEKLIRHFDLISDLAELDKMISSLNDIALIIIDPISAYFGEINSHNNCDVRAVLMPISKLAEKHGIAIVCVSHLNKANAGNAVSRVSGSIAFTAASRATFAVVKDNVNPEKRLFIQVKNNLGNSQLGHVFIIEECQLENDIKISRIQWLNEQVTMTADEALSSLHSNSDEPDTLSEAKDFLLDLLKENPLAAKEIEKESKGAGFAWRTIERAKAALGIKSIKGKNGNGWDWHLAKSKDRQDCQEPQPYQHRHITNHHNVGGDGGVS